MTHPKASARGHTARATLELLPSVLVVIQRASRVLEQDLARDDRPARDFLRSLRTAAYSISSIFRELRDTGLDRELEEYAVALLDAVEASLDTEALGRAAWKASDEKYSNSRALCHLQDTELTSQLLSAAFSLPYSSSHEDLLCTFTDTFDELQVCFPDLSELDLQPTRKRRREPPWGISDSASKAFRAISQCSHGPGCSVIKRLKTRLALATYSGIIEDEQHFVDMLLALDTEKPLWSEMRMHTHIDECGFTGADIKPAVPKVMFADNRGKPTTATYKPRGRAKPIPYFCKLLDASKAHFNATFRVNVTLDTNNEMWQHQPSNRYPKQADLSHSISLGDILASDTRDLNEMAKLVLALILSYSLFYLYGSPWLGPQNAAEWSRDKIIFFMKDGKDGKVPLRPFLRSDLPFNSPEASNVDGEAGDDDDTPFHPYPILVGFGIILLELHMGCTLESFLGLTEPLLSVDDKWARACDVFNQRKPFIPGQKYRNAIETCLDTQFGAGDDDLSGRWTGEDEEDIEQLRHQIFSKVVSPLQDELEYGFGAFIKSDDLDKEAASMDLISGLSVVEEKAYSPILHHTGHGHCMISAPHPTKTSLKAHKGIAPARVRSETPKGLRYAPDLPESIDAGELYTLFGDPNVPSSNSPHEYSPTDTWISKFRQLKALYPLQLLKQGDSNRVRVAIIDTGIDLGHVDMQAAVSDGRIAKVCDWVDGRGGIEDESTGDSIGHGTHITSIILDMAPNVDVYIGRVAKGRELSDDQAENVAKAIHTAWSTWGCSIINLSLGFRRGIPSIELELEAAINAGVLVFAAASNDGANSGLSYPAWRSRVFCIYSTDGYGNRSRFNSLPNENHSYTDGYSIVGEHVSGAWPSKLSPGGDNCYFRRMSGTSFATPVAAALAACVLGFAALAFEPGILDTESFLKLLSYDGMCSVFSRMVKGNGDSGHRYLGPFGFFARGEDEIKVDIWRALNPEKYEY